MVVHDILHELNNIDLITEGDSTLLYNMTNSVVISLDDFTTYVHRLNTIVLYRLYKDEKKSLDSVAATYNMLLKVSIVDKNIDANSVFECFLDSVWLLHQDIINENPRIFHKVERDVHIDYIHLRNVFTVLLINITGKISVEYKDFNLYAFKSKMFECLDFDLLEAIGEIESSEIYKKKTIRLNTSLLYKQQKYNLLIEESEGFSKAFGILGLFTNGGLFIKEENEDLCVLYDGLLEIIGHFHLDPYRIVDFIYYYMIECIKTRKIGSIGVFLQVLVKFRFSKEIMVTLLGLKFQHLHNRKQQVYIELFILTGILVRESIIELTAVLPYVISDKDPHVENILGLIEGLLRVGMFSLSFGLIKDYGSYIKESHLEQLSAYILNFVHIIIDPIYSDSKKHIADKYFIKGTISLNPNSYCKIYYSVEESLRYNGLEKDHFYDHLLNYSFDNFKFLISLDHLLLIKIIRIMKSKQFFSKHLDCLSNVVIPCVLLGKSNHTILFEIWDLIKNLDHKQRYSLYSLWRDKLNIDSPYYQKVVENNRNAVVIETRKILRRLSKDNIKEFGRKLSKLCHNQFTSVLQVVIEQIKSYENLIGPIVECFRYLTAIEKDYINYLISDNVKQKQDNEKIKNDGINFHGWFCNLSSFLGSFSRKNIDTDIFWLVEHVMDILGRDTNFFDLKLFNDMVLSMSGIEMFEDFSQTQIECFCGGFYLKIESFFNSDVIKGSKKSSLRLFGYFCENKLISKMVFLLFKKTLTYIMGKMSLELDSLKILNERIDMIHRAFIQFSELIFLHHDKIGADEIYFLKRKYLLREMGPSHYFYVVRKLNLHNFQNRLRIRLLTDAKASENLDEFVIKERMLLDSDFSHVPYKDCDMSTSFYYLFWNLSVYDIYSPSKQYERRLKELNDDLLSVSDPSQGGKNREKILFTTNNIEKDFEIHRISLQPIQNYLVQHKSSWFSNSKSIKNSADFFVKYCLCERMLFSVEDALFCSKFIKKLHFLGVDNLSILSVYNGIVDSLECIMGFITCNEAINLGIFLNDMLLDLNEWFVNESLYKKEIIGDLSLPGFFNNWNSSGMKDKGIDDFLQHLQYCNVFHKWNSILFDTFNTNLSKDEFIYNKNAILVLTKISGSFPIFREFGEKLLSLVLERSNDLRDDLKVLAKSYYSILKNNESRWIEHKKDIVNCKNDPSDDSKIRKRGKDNNSYSKGQKKPRSGDKHSPGRDKYYHKSTPHENEPCHGDVHFKERNSKYHDRRMHPKNRDRSPSPFPYKTQSRR